MTALRERIDYLVHELVNEWHANLRIKCSGPLDSQAIWKSAVFCILSSQVRFEHAQKLTALIVGHVPFFRGSLSVNELQSQCFGILSSPKLRHRFPNLKAKQIALSWVPYSQIMDDFYDYASSFETEDFARKNIMSMFAGMGMKQSSMFLRDIDVCQNLAIIDSHVLWYLERVENWMGNISHSDGYRRAENLLERRASDVGLSVAEYDIIIWTAVRALKRRSYV